MAKLIYYVGNLFPRKRERYYRSLSWRALKPDFPLLCFDESPADRQSQSHPGDPVLFHVGDDAAEAEGDDTVGDFEDVFEIVHDDEGMPTPVSRTHTVATPPPSGFAPTRISPLDGVNFTAL